MCDKTSKRLKAMEQYLTGNLFVEFSQAWALLFYVILPGQSRHQIQNVRYKMGRGSLEKCMEQCTRKPTDEEMDKIRAACAQDGPSLPAYIQHGCHRCTQGYQSQVSGRREGCASRSTNESVVGCE